MLSPIRVDPLNLNDDPNDPDGSDPGDQPLESRIKIDLPVDTEVLTGIRIRDGSGDVVTFQATEF
jgi:hypothetical protein